MPNSRLLARYDTLTAQGLVSFDQAQMPALNALDKLHEKLLNPVEDSSGDGLYLWGKVGRGKTFLMDTFVESLPQEMCLRQHFHHFMRDVHHQLTLLAGTIDPLKHIAAQLKSQHQVLCFDEFFVNDIGDAMLLGRLMMYLFDEGMIVVATSNCEPNELYKDGLQRDNFLPAIKAIYDHMHIVELSGKKDHRERALHKLQNYFVLQQDDKGSYELINTLFSSLGLSHKPGQIHVLGRDIQYQAMLNKRIAFDFEDVCLGPRSHFDYIEIAKRFDTLVLLNVPALGGEASERIKARGTEDGSVGSGNTGERHVLLAPLDDGARRFIALIDELYDQKVTLFITAQVSLNELYTQGSLDFQFERARSRLIEMGSEEYMGGVN